MTLVVWFLSSRDAVGVELDSAHTCTGWSDCAVVSTLSSLLMYLHTHSVQSKEAWRLLCLPITSGSRYTIAQVIRKPGVLGSADHLASYGLNL